MMLENATGRFWDKKSIRLFVLLLAAFLSVAALPDVTWADETTHNETMLDETSDDFLNSNADDVTIDEYGLDYISDSLRYSEDKGMYVYSLGDFAEYNVYSNVCGGMTVNEPVIIEADEGVNITLYKDDVEQEDPDLTSISDPGNYLLYVKAGNLKTEELFRFTVIGSSSNIYSFSVPSDFAISSVIFNGEDSDSYYSSVDTTEEGEYLISYTCMPTGLSNTLRVTIDHTPPTLKLEGVKNGKAHHAVDISDMESGASIYITKDGTSIGAQTKLVDYGRYKIILEDAAGNRTEYSFKIMVYFTAGTYIFLIVFLLVAAGVGFYIWYSKNHLRVR